ncbi:hypothetical protein V1523DRAFT_353874, partial [Lipomyces doorenjongii]
VRVVAMNNALTTSDLADNLHPNDGGYIKMAETYFSAIEKANSLGLISKAGTLSDPPTDATTPENCRSTPSWYNVGTVAEGAKVYVAYLSWSSPPFNFQIELAQMKLQS